MVRDSMIKKVFVFILALFLLTGTWFSAPVRGIAASLPGENILGGSGFEGPLNEQGEAEPWKISGGGWGQGNCGNVVTAQDAPEGDSYMCLQSTAASTKPILLQPSVPIEAGATYNLTFYVRSEEGTRAAVKLEYYKAGVSGSVDFLSESLSDTNGEWVEKSIRFTPSVEIQPTKVSFLFRLSAAGTVHWDNIRCVKVQEAPYSVMLTDEKFYYTGTETGTATLSKTGLRTVDGEITADFSLCDEDGTVINERRDIPFSDESVQFTYSVADFALKKKYTVFYTVHADGIEVESGAENVYRYNRPWMIDGNGKIYHPADVSEDGKITVGAKPFMPVMGYHVQTDNTEQYTYASRIGVNVIQFFPWSTNPASIEKKLDLLAQHNLMAFVALYGSAVEDAQKIVEASMLHDAVFGYMLMDESLNNGESMEKMETLYKAVRDVDDKHPTYLVESMSKKHKYAEIARYADIFATDPYPASAENAGTNPTVGLETARAAVRDKKPVMCINQCFPLAGYQPDGEAVRNMTYQALLAGASGIGYYDLRDTKGYNEDGTTDEEKFVHLWERVCWSDMVSFAENEMDFAYKAFISGEYEILSENMTDTYWYRMLRAGENVRCVLLNRTNSAQSVEIPLSEPCCSVSVLAGNSANTPVYESGKIKVSLLPLSALLLEPGEALVFMQNGRETETLQSGTVSIKYCHYSAENSDFTVYIALYGGEVPETEMVHVAPKSRVTAGKSQMVTLEMPVQSAAGRYIKVFVMENGSFFASRIYELRGTAA
ncbi:MAG: hypothetical protein E7390_01485 [Ruminococcaceae bacterium]|nr:hypothetical protein [Oscillospiraceae bacterium]